MVLEIERKFLCSLTREEAETFSFNSKQVKSIYLKNTPKEILRVVKDTYKNGDVVCKWTEKFSTNNPTVREEIEETLPSLIFDTIDQQNYPTVNKERFFIKHNFLTWEVDFFIGYDFVIAEVEFETIEDANDLSTLPSWIIQEVSKDPKYLNCNLAF